ncbi:MAG: hypothetical protein ABI606_19430, partial [Rhodoferax sp.]
TRTVQVRVPQGVEVRVLFRAPKIEKPLAIARGFFFGGASLPTLQIGSSIAVTFLVSVLSFG